MNKDFIIKEVMTPKGVVTLFVIKNGKDNFVELSSLGAGITRIVVPDKTGVPTDVVLGYDNVEDYFYDSPCAGKTPGRFANRIAKGRFRIDGNACQLQCNDGENALHGGPEGFHNRIWDYEIIERGVKFSYLSVDGEEGYPGNLKVMVTYLWGDDNTLTINYDAETDTPTIVNLTNHAYFNLHGDGKGNCLDHLMTIDSMWMVQTDGHDIPTGRIMPVAGTPFDFRKPKTLGQDIAVDFENLLTGKGYNHYFLIDEAGDCKQLRHAATLWSEDTGIRLDVETTMPGMMLYTGNWLAQSPTGKGGRVYDDYSGVAIECQFPPDSPNQKEFPSTELRPGGKYSHQICYSFK